MNYQITVSNISTRADQKRILSYFQLAGPIVDREIRRNECKLWATFRYADYESAEIACRLLDKTCLQDREIKITPSEQLRKEMLERAKQKERRREQLLARREELSKEVKALSREQKLAWLARFKQEQEKQPQKFRLLLSESRQLVNLVIQTQQDVMADAQPS